MLIRKEAVLLKGIAILMIIGYHFQAALTQNGILPTSQGLIAWLNHLSLLPWYKPKYLISLLLWPGFLGVNIFFVLSGYGLSQKYNQLKVGVRGMYLGMAHQIKKLYPAYALSHPIVHLGSGLIWIFIWHKSLTFGRWLSFYPWQNYLKSLLIFPRWLNNYNMFIFDGTWWFIGVIVQLYLFFPLLYWLKKKWGNENFLLFVLVITFGYRFLIWKLAYSGPIGINGSQSFWWVNFPARLAEFGLGMALTEKHFQFFKGKGLMGLAVLFLALASGLIPAFWFMSDFLLALAGIWLGYWLIFRLSRSLRNSFFKVGKYSYYLYLLQEPFLGSIIRGY